MEKRSKGVTVKIDVSSVEALTFDVFGTAVDWCTGIIREGTELEKSRVRYCIVNAALAERKKGKVSFFVKGCPQLATSQLRGKKFLFVRFGRPVSVFILRTIDNVLFKQYF